MEDSPAYFNVWCQIRQGMMASAVKWIAKTRGLTLAEAMSVVRSVVDGDGWIRVYMRVGWADVVEGLGGMPDFCVDGSVKVAEYDCKPPECTRHCAVHDLHYWSEGCPVCGRFYIISVKGAVHTAVVPDGHD